MTRWRSHMGKALLRIISRRRRRRRRKRKKRIRHLPYPYILVQQEDIFHIQIFLSNKKTSSIPIYCCPTGRHLPHPYSIYHVHTCPYSIYHVPKRGYMNSAGPGAFSFFKGPGAFSFFNFKEIL